MRRRFLGAVAVSCVMVASPEATADMQMRSGGAVRKLGRGFVNVVTGWVEIPKRIDETSWDQGMAAGMTWGLLRGLGHGFIRTAAGAYEMVTFPVPAPPDYAPVIEPAFVFTRQR